MEVTEEPNLDYQEPYKLHNFQIIEDNEEAWSKDNLNSHPQCSNDDADFDSSYKRRPVKYWRNWNINEKYKNKRNRLLKSVQNKFRRVSSECQLRRWEEQLHSGENHIEKLSYISKTHNKFTAAVASGFIVHDIDLQRWALQAQEKSIIKSKIVPIKFISKFSDSSYEGINGSALEILGQAEASISVEGIGANNVIFRVVPNHEMRSNFRKRRD
ncbi:hypothetical protein ALC57_11399 [Trachymyrmex cornetzi]|uniref:Uncharacterized protein n=1 Tax=Trachymyrmex cornetzi TaxID=471704 RepID=A0A151J2M6_9HYME|nr:hypothetical protein ALC57_11399 [Trachymyrmex cornetzi]